MYVPQLYAVALSMLVLTMVCWGCWVVFLRLCKNWRFELFYWDYVWGILLAALVIGVTLGRTDPSSADSFFQNLSSADSRHLIYALLGGAIFTLANILIVAAISIAGMAVAFPVGIGLALVIGTVLNYVLKPVGHPVLLFGGIGMVCLAIVLDAMAYRKRSGDVKVTTKGIVLSIVGGVFMGLFYPFIVKATTGEGHLGPYTVALLFTIGAALGTLPVNYVMMRWPVSGPPLSFKDYLAGSRSTHFWGVVSGIVFMVGTTGNFVVSYAQTVGPAISYALGQGSTMIGTIWGVFIWKEFRGSGPAVNRLLALMFLFFILGLTAVALAPVVAH
jgi:glucose uptake protein